MSSKSNQAAIKLLKTKSINELISLNMQIIKATESEKKLSSTSKKFCEAGDKLLKQCSINKTFIASIIVYNKALCFAETDLDAALAYDGRSAVLGRIEAYEKAICNIEMARAKNHPEPEKLNKREALCKKALEKQKQSIVDIEENGSAGDCEGTNSVNNEKTEQSEQEGSDGPDGEPGDQEPSEGSSYYYDEYERTELKLSRDAHPKIPWIIDCLELQEDGDKKKCLVTTDELLVGEIIAVEKPLTASCFFKGLRSNCVNCLKFAISLMIPCPGCTTAMFCSEDCLENAKYHRFECAAISKIVDTPMHVRYAVVQALFISLGAFDGDVPAMNDFLSANEGKTIFDFDFNDPTSPDFEKNFVGASYHNLTNTSMSMKEQEIRAKYCKDLLEIFPCSRKVLKCHKCKAFVLESLVKQSVNIRCLTSQNKGNETVWTGGVFPMMRMMPHSCAPNVETVFLHDGRLAYVVTFPIQANEALTLDQLNLNFSEKSKTQRLKAINDFSGSGCSCIACNSDYPSKGKLRIADKKMMKQVEGDLRRIKEIEVAELDELINEYGYFIDDHQENYPTKEMVLMQKFISSSLIEFSDAIGKDLLMENFT